MKNVPKCIMSESAVYVQFCKDLWEERTKNLRLYKWTGLQATKQAIARKLLFGAIKTSFGILPDKK